MQTWHKSRFLILPCSADAVSVPTTFLCPARLRSFLPEESVTVPFAANAPTAQRVALSKSAPYASPSNPMPLAAGRRDRRSYMPTMEADKRSFLEAPIPTIGERIKRIRLFRGMTQKIAEEASRIRAELKGDHPTQISTDFLRRCNFSDCLRLLELLSSPVVLNVPLQGQRPIYLTQHLSGVKCEKKQGALL